MLAKVVAEGPREVEPAIGPLVVGGAVNSASSSDLAGAQDGQALNVVWAIF